MTLLLLNNYSFGTSQSTASIVYLEADLLDDDNEIGIPTMESLIPLLEAFSEVRASPGIIVILIRKFAFSVTGKKRPESSPAQRTLCAFTPAENMLN